MCRVSPRVCTCSYLEWDDPQLPSIADVVDVAVVRVHRGNCIVREGICLGQIDPSRWHILPRHDAGLPKDARDAVTFRQDFGLIVGGDAREELKELLNRRAAEAAVVDSAG